MNYYMAKFLKSAAPARALFSKKEIRVVSPQRRTGARTAFFSSILEKRLFQIKIVKIDILPESEISRRRGRHR